MLMLRSMMKGCGGVKVTAPRCSFPIRTLDQYFHSTTSHVAQVLPYAGEEESLSTPWMMVDKIPISMPQSGRNSMSPQEGGDLLTCLNMAALRLLAPERIRGGRIKKIIKLSPYSLPYLSKVLDSGMLDEAVIPRDPKITCQSESHAFEVASSPTLENGAS